VRKPLPRHVTDEVDLDQRVLDQEAGGADGGARRRQLEVALPNRIEAVKIGEIGEKDLRLDHVIERGAGGFEGLFQVFEHIGRLQLDIRPVVRKARMPARLRGNSILEVARELACGEDKIADDEGLAIIGERARCARSHDLDSHVPSRCSQ
jgi:hypothetical protein